MPFSGMSEDEAMALMSVWGYYHAGMTAYVPFKEECAVCAEEVDTSGIYMVITDINSNAHFDCVYEKVMEHDDGPGILC
jgi:hypothetical protein